MTFYESVKHIDHDHHESDLYLLYTAESRQLMRQHRKTGVPFRSTLDNRLYVDIPFAYEPWWIARCGTNTYV